MLPIFKKSETGLSKLAASSSTPGLGPSSVEVSSVIGADLTINGDLVSKGELKVDGEVHGDIRGIRVVISESAHITGGIVAEEIIIRGQVTGLVRGLVVTLQSTSHVEGDIFHRAFAMEHGASFEGRSRRSDDLPVDSPKPYISDLNGSGDPGSCHVGAGPPGFLCLRDQPIFSRPTFGTPTEDSTTPKGHPNSDASSLPPIGTFFGNPSIQRARAVAILPRSEPYVPLGEDAEPAPIPLRVPPLVSQVCGPHHWRRFKLPNNISEPLPFGIRRPPERERWKLSTLELLCAAFAVSALFYLGSLAPRTEDPWIKSVQAELQARPHLAAVADLAHTWP
jgi:cytoskeletal protein CcmA (bactofilin family)